MLKKNLASHFKKFKAPQQQPILGFPFHGIDPNVFAQVKTISLIE